MRIMVQTTFYLGKCLFGFPYAKMVVGREKERFLRKRINLKCDVQMLFSDGKLHRNDMQKSHKLLRFGVIRHELNSPLCMLKCCLKIAIHKKDEVGELIMNPGVVGVELKGLLDICRGPLTSPPRVEYARWLPESRRHRRGLQATPHDRGPIEALLHTGRWPFVPRQDSSG